MAVSFLLFLTSLFLPCALLRKQQDHYLHLDVSVCCSGGGGDGWHTAGTVARPWVSVVITGRDGCSLATSSRWLVGRKERKERGKKKERREVRKTQLEARAGEAVVAELNTIIRAEQDVDGRKIKIGEWNCLALDGVYEGKLEICAGANDVSIASPKHATYTHYTAANMH